MDRKMLKSRAKEVLKKHYIKLLGFTFVTVVLGLSFVGFTAKTDAYTYATNYYFTVFGLSFKMNPTGFMMTLVGCYLIVSVIFAIAVNPALNYGLLNAYKHASNDELDNYNLFKGFKSNYKNIVVVNFMKSLYVALWTLVFIVPGIIKSYQWRYTHQILEEHPDWDYKKVLEASENMTNGHKMDLFVLDLSFIGWYFLFGLLSVLTLGFANYLLMPYVQQTDAEAYHWLNSLQNPEVLDVEAEIIE